MADNPPKGGPGQKSKEGEDGPGRRQRQFHSLRQARPENLAAVGSRWHLLRRSHVEEYRQRLRRLHAATPGALAVRPSAVPPGARRRLRFAEPAVPGLANWRPLGPSVVLNGQAATRPPVSGRATAVAVAADGQRVYLGSANGGVWRSDDAGRTWYPLMNAFDLHPTAFKADSLSVGAIALHPDHPDRVYVGSGEGGLAVDSYFGVGPIVTDDGGLNWRTEHWNAGPGGPTFFALAVDPANPERVVGGTSQGLFRRQSRNEAQFPGRTHPPQSYLLSYGPATGAWDLGYWSAEGHTVFDVQSGGALSWSKWLVFMPFTLNGVPHFVSYEAEVSIWSPLQRTGQYRVFSLQPDGTPQQLQQGQWELGLQLMPVELGGTSAFVRYSSRTGRATLEAWNADGTTRQLWARAWDTGWSQLMPFTLNGVPHFLAYNTGGILSGGPAMLYRWSGTGDVTPVWSATKNLGHGLQLTPFALEGVPYFQAYKRATGEAYVARWDADGSFTEPRPRESLAPELEFTPFVFRGEARLIGYHAQTGRTSVFRWAPDASRHLLWTGRWADGRKFMPLQMGYEWRAVPGPSIVPAPVDPRASSVVVARTGDTTTFYAAYWDGYVYQSTDGGLTWQGVGINLPLGGGVAGRVTLAVQATNPGTVYAQLMDGTLWRNLTPPLTHTWIQVEREPAGYVSGQGWYDLALAVAPDDVNTLFLGGSTTWATVDGRGDWSGSIYRSVVNPAVPNVANIFLGASAHADIHAFAFTPGQANSLWVACDGGVFFTPNTRTAHVNHVFRSLNAGLATMTPNKLGQHPTQDAIVFSGTQDNGCQRYAGDEAWDLLMAGDSGVAVVDPNPANNGQRILASYNANIINRSLDGGATFARVTGYGTGQIDPLPFNDSVEFYAPLVSAGATLPQRVAFGTRAPWVSDDFGTTWNVLPPLLGPPAPADAYNITALAFSPNGLTLFAGLKNGLLYSYLDAGGGAWGPPTDLTALPGFPAFGVPVTSITLDPSNAAAFYVTFGGDLSAVPLGWQRVWHCDGANWTARSGPGAGDPASLMNIQYNTLVARLMPGPVVHLYAGADLGVWRSEDGGVRWSPFGLGLPESAVLDLKLFEAAGPIPALLRAATHGRGIFELVLSDEARFLKHVQLYLRRTVLDRGLYPVQDGAIDPTDPAQARVVNHRDGVDLKLTLPVGGPDSDTFASPADVTFAEFATLQDQSLALRQRTRTRLYLQVHNRGVVVADGVRLTVLLSRSVGPVPGVIPPLSGLPNPPALPAGYAASIRNGTFLRGPDWSTRFVLALDDLHAGYPEVLSVDFPRDTFLAAGLYCVLVVAHSPDDPFSSNEVNVDTLTVAQRQVALKYLAVT